VSARPRLLDAYCSAMGAGVADARAGFDVVGVDIRPQPNAPFRVVVGDAVAFIREHGHEFDVIHASPPCARLHAPAVYCGSSFGLPIHRHRQFESTVLLLTPACEHDRLTDARYWTGYSPKGQRRRSTVVQVYGNGGEREAWGPALGIDWMTPDELTQAIPPAYTEHIGLQLLAALERQPVAA
jgi:DNA (cytosine-5)-methyltransferase 1